MNPNEKPGTSEFLEITAAAAGGKHPKVSGVAYGGGKMTLWGWSKPVVVAVGIQGREVVRRALVPVVEAVVVRVGIGGVRPLAHLGRVEDPVAVGVRVVGT